MRKNLIIISIIIAVIAILGLVFIFIDKEKPVAVQAVKEFPTQQPQSIHGILPYNEQSDGYETFKKNDSLFENIEDIVSKLNFDTQQQAQEINPLLQLHNDSADIASVEQQVFNILFPDYFTDGLSDTQEFYIEQGFLDANYEKIEKFDSEEKIFAFVNTIIDVSEEQDIYSAQDAEKFKNGVNQIWKSLLEEEEKYWRKKIIGSEFYDRILANRQHYIRKSASKKISKIFEIIKNAATPSVYAADCYRGGAGTSGGSNVWAQCCNCGYNTDGRHVWYVEDCGGGCNLQNLGCKNKYSGRPVIWDSSSGICGVG